MKNKGIVVSAILFLSLNILSSKAAGSIIVDTGQDQCYDTSQETLYPLEEAPFYGQDAQYISVPMAYQDNGDGTVTDLNTGLMWCKAVDDNKVSLEEALNIVRNMNLGGYNDWRVPNIKELYSLIDFRGNTGFSGRDMSSIPSDVIPFINTDYFDFKFGQIENGERYIDGQWLSSTKYVSTTMDGAETLFGVNFVDGRIKGYGYTMPGRAREKKFYVRYVRGERYGDNDYIDNGDDVVTDAATGLVWMKRDSGKAMTWEEALEYSENLEFAGYDDWRLPNAKELQYIVDYSRSPDTSNSPAINPIFQTTAIVNEGGEKDYPYFWTSTTHLDGPNPGANAAYVSFGRAMGKMNEKIMDVHGAGAQRSDPKIGSPASRGPQGDMLRINNFVRCVRGGNIEKRTSEPGVNMEKYPYNVNIKKYSSSSSGQNMFKNNDVRNSGDMQGPPGNQGGMQRPSGMQGQMGGFVERLDNNGDGKVSRSEFDGPSNAFDHHDTNRDGYLSEEEAPKRPPPHSGRRR